MLVTFFIILRRHGGRIELVFWSAYALQVFPDGSFKMKKIIFTVVTSGFLAGAITFIAMKRSPPLVPPDAPATQSALVKQQVKKRAQKSRSAIESFTGQRDYRIIRTRWQRRRTP